MNWEASRGFWPNAQHSRFIEAAGHRWHVQEAGSRAVPAAAARRGRLDAHLAPAPAGSRARLSRRRTGPARGRASPASGTRRCGLAEMSADIATLLAGQGLAPDVIVGHSAGAAIGLRLALDLPRQAEGCRSASTRRSRTFAVPRGAVFPALAQVLSMTPLPAFAFSRAARLPSTVRRAIASTGSTIDATGLDLYRWLLMDSGHVDATLCMMAQLEADGAPARFAAARRADPLHGRRQRSRRAAGHILPRIPAHQGVEGRGIPGPRPSPSRGGAGPDRARDPGVPVVRSPCLIAETGLAHWPAIGHGLTLEAADTIGP